MLEIYTLAFEPFQEVSFFFLLCGGAGTGKSMRAMRMQDLLCDGWIKKSGTTSARAGMNGGGRAESVPWRTPPLTRIRLRRYGQPLRTSRLLR